MDIRTEHPFFLARVAGAVGSDDGHDSFDRSFRQVDSDEEKPANARQLRFRETSTDKREPHTKRADSFAVTSGRLRIRNFAGLYIPIDQGYCTGQVGVKAWATPAIGILYLAFRGCAVVRTERVEPFEHEAASVAEEFMQPDYTEQQDGVIVIALNPFTVTSWAPHAPILTRFASVDRKMQIFKATKMHKRHNCL